MVWISFLSMMIFDDSLSLMMMPTPSYQAKQPDSKDNKVDAKANAALSVAASLEPTVNGVVILDAEGNRIAAKYYSKDAAVADLKSQVVLERRIFEKATKQATRHDGKWLLAFPR